MLCLLSACQPALNWREVRPEGSRAVALFPCKPDVEQRPGMGLAHCKAGEREFALSWADLPDPTQARAALKAMPRALAEKLKSPLREGPVLAVPGMTPLPESAQYRLTSVNGVTRVEVFAHGGRVYQALMTVGLDDAEAWDGFVKGLSIETAR